MAISNPLVGNINPKYENGVAVKGYGQRATTVHAGVDVSAPNGTPIRAPFDGIVFGVGTAGSEPLTSGRTGQYVIIRSAALGVDFYSGHHSASLVSKGQQVSQGQVFANVGATGNATGPHGHFEIRTLGTTSTFNPDTWFAERGITLGVTPTSQTNPIQEDDDMTPAQDAALAYIYERTQRFQQILDALDYRTGNAGGNLATAARQVDAINSRVNYSAYPNGTGMKIACQGDVDQILAKLG